MKLHLGPDLNLPANTVKLAEARIWSKINKRGTDECWPWLASCDTYGYGHIRIAGCLISAARAIFLLVNGWLPALVMHSCDNPPCCNPAHLSAGTKALNNADKMAKGRFHPCMGDANGMRKHPERACRGDEHYARRHPELLARGEKNGQAKVTAEEVSQMRFLFAQGGRTMISIGRQFGIGQSQIGRILRSEAWHG